jgi:hypothetical protein
MRTQLGTGPATAVKLGAAPARPKVGPGAGGSMRLVPLVAVALLAVAASAADAPEGLELDLALTTKGPVQPGEKIEYTLSLVNRSKAATHSVVRPNEGSEAAWREPHVYWTATIVGADGAERPVAAAPFERAGMFLAQWWKDVAKLAPGESLPVTCMIPLNQALDVQDDGRLRVVAHYAWDAGKNSRSDPMEGTSPPPADLGGMKGVAPYEIVSKAAEIEVRRAFDVVVTAKGAFKVGVAVRLSEIADVRVVSRSPAPLTLDPAAWTATLATDPKDPDPPSQDVVAPRRGAKPFDLAPAASTPLFRAGPFAEARDLTLRFEAPGRTRIAVVLERNGGAGPRIRSKWIEVDVAK